MKKELCGRCMKPIRVINDGLPGTVYDITGICKECENKPTLTYQKPIKGDFRLVNYILNGNQFEDDHKKGDENKK